MTHTQLGSRALLACALVSSACTNQAPVDWNQLMVRESACSGQHIDRLYAGISRSITADRSLESLAQIATQCASATTCDAYNACRHIGAAGSCTTPTSTTCTDATHAQYCQGGRSFTMDCSEDPFGNNRCITDSRGLGGCASAMCTVDGSSCEGDAIVSCSGGVARRTDCAALGRHCAASTNGTTTSITCVQQVEACTADRCEGNVMVQCDNHAGVNRTDCRAAAGATGTCQLADGVARCVAATRECDEGAAECQGSVIRICINGTWERFDCAAFGNGTCVSAGEGGFGPQFDCRLP